MKYFYRVHYSKTPSHYDVQSYPGPLGKNQPLANACYTFSREQQHRIA